MSDNILGSEKVYKLFIQFSVPAVISMLITGIQTMIDGLFLGNFVGPHAMASVNIAQPFIQLILGSTFMVCMGALSLIGRRLGEQKEEDAKNIFKTAFLCLVVTSLSILLLGSLFRQQIAVVLGATPLLLPYVSTYIFIMSFFAPAMSSVLFFGFMLRLIGRPDLYLKATLLSIFLNVTLDYLLIVVLDLGIAGAAFATGLSYLGGALVVILPMFQKKHLLNLSVGKFTPSTILPMLYNGSSEAVISIAAALTAFLFNITFLEIAGEDGVAAFTAISYITHFGTLLMFGVSDGIGPIISYNYGNERPDRVTAILKLSYGVNLVSGVFIFCILFFFGPSLAMAFTGNNPVILDLVDTGSKFYAFAFLMNGFCIVTSGFFTSIGKAKESVFVAGSRGIVCILVGILILPQFFGLNGVWLTIPFAELVTLLLSFYLLYRLRKHLSTKK